MQLAKTALGLLLVCSTIAGCTTADPTAYTGLSSSSRLKPNVADKGGREPYRYQGNVDWRQYNKVIVDPVTIYSGTDAQFAKVAPGDRSTLAAYMQAQFTEKLKSRFAIVSMPDPGTLRLHLTLTGAKTTTPVLGTLSHIDIAGGVYNGVQAVRGGEGSMTGSVNYAVEVYDATTNELLLAYVSKQYPNAMNVGASVGTLKASMVGIEKGADALLDKLN